MMKKLISILSLLTLTLSLSAQQAGTYTYDFLNLANSARIGALGGNQVGMGDDDVNLMFNNPSVLTSAISNNLTISYVPYVSEVNIFYTGYAHHIENIGTFGVGIHSINYGTFNRADEEGNLQGTFSASEYAIQLSYAKMLSPNLNLGISMKPIISSFEQYNSFGLAADIGMMYKSTDQLFSAGLVVKNLGSQITTYNNTYESIPTDLQIGIAKKLAHAPFRLALTAQDLLDWNLKYTVNNGSGDVIEGEGNNGNGFDQLMRHMVIGIEFIPSENFWVDFGYNHRRRKELSIGSKMSTVGYSWGFGFKVYKFKFAYGSARYHLSGTSNHFTLTARLSDF
ncbi:type IX secretion system protein PorQ [Carboxylicivirga caseinilyticus]|uniref:type IX secretion system protein PorQ n=1 Tax=Carboxylicivirga caseinilyticus TaxID=3417572 RepID=UPI003D326558|nr:type IX secretion system protein PorQ [Marinilabiliaceae bacterium A049]